MNHKVYLLFAVSFCCLLSMAQTKSSTGMKLNELEYLEYQGVNIMPAHAFYPESHQGGVGVIQNGLGVANNGDIRLEPTPGQWQLTPKVAKRLIDK